MKTKEFLKQLEHGSYKDYGFFDKTIKKEGDGRFAELEMDETKEKVKRWLRI